MVFMRDKWDQPVVEEELLSGLDCSLGEYSNPVIPVHHHYCRAQPQHQISISTASHNHSQIGNVRQMFTASHLADVWLLEELILSKTSQHVHVENRPLV